MQRAVLGVVVALSAASAVWAQEWQGRSGDVAFDVAALTDRLAGQRVVFFDEGQSVYEANGQYQYTYGGGGTWYGHWEVRADSVVCVTFVTGVERCDRFVENDGQLVLQTVDGMRFPIRRVEALS